MKPAKRSPCGVSHLHTDLCSASMILSLDVQTMLDKIETVEQLENVMSYPTKEVVNAMLELEGDLLILGVGGKMGPTLAKLAKRAIDNANLDNK